MTTWILVSIIFNRGIAAIEFSTKEKCEKNKPIIEQLYKEKFKYATDMLLYCTEK